MVQDQMNQQLAIKISPHEGHYLTELDWLKSDVSTLCYDLDNVVFQPQHIEPRWENIANMIHPWPKSVLIDIRKLSFKREKLTLQSPFTGQKFHIMWSDWLAEAIHSSDYYWIIPNKDTLSADCVDWLNKLPQKKLVYANPNFTLANNWQLFEEHSTGAIQTLDDQNRWLLAEKLCRKTTDGWIMGNNDIYQISDFIWKESDTPLAESCSCEACERNLKRSYFHHLYHYVPLLANRYLTLHNLCQLKFYI